MKISRDGVVPQVELGPRIGGFKVLYQRASVVSGIITMVSAMTAAYSTTPVLRDIFGSFTVFLGAAVVILFAYMGFDFMFLLPSEQRFIGTQAQRTERSPLKRDTEEILRRLDGIDTTGTRADGGEDHLRDIPDGCGCVEVWEELSERR